MRGLARIAKRLGLVGVLVLSALAFAQDETYRLQPEDIIRIQVYNETQINAELPVGIDGKVSAPFVGIIQAAGRTTAEIEAELARLYIDKLRLREPRVAVTIIRFRQLKATVGGSVSRPGTYEVRPGDTVITLLNYGGGAIPDRADLRRATLRRAGSNEKIPLDLYSVLMRGDTSQNYEVQDGDELLIPEESSSRILVIGTVSQPGSYLYREPMTLADALSMARGEVPTRSKLSEITIIRKAPGMPGQYVRLKANFVNFVRKGDFTQNVMLEPGDLVFVPSTKTPDIGQVTNSLIAANILERFLREGLLGFRLLGR
ncbi:MAG: SLBB domain-containing protein [Fimbriimonadaceae bacterium]|nr:SLBB domain-containing protein [Fimbriimonadaceae bacterium]NUM38666.1 SLBB domain-containing protein [Armatimonadota bacterium]